MANAILGKLSQTVSAQGRPRFLNNRRLRVYPLTQATLS